MNNEVLEFIKRRFKNDCNWTDGNCYYFTLILKDRFPEGMIFYDVREGHFVFEYHEKYYDWNGIIKCKADYLVPWHLFDKYDSIQKEVIVRDCIM